jgi:hypothetical protein
LVNRIVFNFLRNPGGKMTNADIDRLLYGRA